MSRQTYFSSSWLREKDKYPSFTSWLNGKEGSMTFSCKLCKKTLQLGNMGVKALTAQETRTVHQKLVKFNKDQKPLPDSFPNGSKAATQTTLPAATLVRQVKEAEVLMAVQSVTNHVSNRTMEKFATMSKVFFPDSQIASRVELGRTKIGYLITFDLASYYMTQLFRSLLPGTGTVPRFISCFDEAFNRVSKQRQMDVYITFFDEKKSPVVGSYLGSHFMGHATAEDRYKSLAEIHNGLDLVHNLVQISMDGPNVNWKTLDIVSENRTIEDPDCPQLINIGSCGLHVIHGAYGTAQKVTDWLLQNYLKAIYLIFKLSPAHREDDYLATNGLLESHATNNSSYLVPLKFCGHLCLENGTALLRAIGMDKNLKMYFKYLEDMKKLPAKDDRFTNSMHLLGSSMHLATLHFSLCIAN